MNKRIKTKAKKRESFSDMAMKYRLKRLMNALDAYKKFMDDCEREHLTKEGSK